VTHHINLFNAALQPRRVVLPARHMLLGWGVALVAAMATYGSHVAYGHRLAAQDAALRARATALQSDVQRLGARLSSREPSPQLERELRQKQALLDARQEVLDALQAGDFGDTDGHARFLRAFARQSLQGLWLTGLTVAGSGQEIRVDGRTLDPGLLPDYLKRLGTEAVLQGHAFNHLEMHRAPAEPSEAADTAVQVPRFVEFTLASRAVGDSPSGRAR
jgi:hypothetical protein